MDLQSIEAGNQALAYIERRLRSPDYRGNHKSQHNRFDMERLTIILKTFHKYVGGQKMTIRNTDLSKRPQNTPEEAVYARFCAETSSMIGSGSQDAMRKNYFVDFERMGLLYRYNEAGVLNPGTGKFSTRYVQLTPLAQKFLNSNLVDRAFIYSKGIDQLLEGTIETMIELLGDTEATGGKVSLDEYMFILSAIGDSSDIVLTKTEALQFLKEYRNLSITQRHAVDDLIRDYAEPDHFAGNKTDQRDYHNWKNECQQIFDLLGQTVYLENHIKPNTQVLTFKTVEESSVKEVATRLKRSDVEKQKYFTEHEVDKKLGFELHHVVPLLWSESLQHFKLLDSWKNMVYIDAYSHAQMSQKGSRYVRMKFVGQDLELTDYAGNVLQLKEAQNIVYNPALREQMQKYNDELNAL